MPEAPVADNPDADVPASDTDTPLAVNVRAAMHAAGWSQRETARQAGVNQSTISRLLTGRDDPDTVAKLAAAFGTTAEALRADPAAAAAPPPPAAAAGEPAAPPPPPKPVGSQAAADKSSEPGSPTRVPLLQLEASPLNPRKIFDADKLAELADSIEAHGLLQPLEVRLIPKSRRDDWAVDRYWIVFGERRFRALSKLANEDRLPADIATQGVPVTIAELDDRAHLERALVENMQRADVTPGEEADAFAALAALGATTAEIAAAIGKAGKSGQRYVQQRLQLAGRLAPEVRAALDDPDSPVDFSRARVLATAEPKRQLELLREIEESPHWVDTRRLRQSLTRDAFPAERARFDLARYSGEVYTDEDGADWLRDADQAKALQEAWVGERKAALEATGRYASVEIVSRLDPADYAPCDDPARALALLEYWKYTGEYAEHLGVVETAAEPDGDDAEAEAARAAEAAARAARVAAQQARTEAFGALCATLHDALAADPLTALRAELWGTLLQYRDDQPCAGDRRVGAATLAALRSIGAPFAAAASLDGDGDLVLPPASVSPAAVWRWLGELDAPGLATLAGAGSADTIGIRRYYQPVAGGPDELRLSPGSAALCRTVGVAVPDTLAPSQLVLDDAIAVAEHDADWDDDDRDDDDRDDDDDEEAAA